MNDEALYLDATREAEGKARNEALWAKSMALCDGDELKAKYHYIKLRVVQLSEKAVNDDLENEEYENAHHQERSEAEKISDDGVAPQDQYLVDNEFDRLHLPVSGFTNLTSIDESTVIQRIQDGTYSGRTKEGIWYIARHELERHEQEKNSSENPLSSEFESAGIGWLERMIAGHYSLPMTYWGFGIGGSLVFSIIFFIAGQFDHGLPIILAYVTHTLFAITLAIGTWRSADRYTGPKVWAILAKISGVLGMVSTVAGYLLMLK